MAGREFNIPFGPDKTGGLPLDAVSTDEGGSDSFGNSTGNPSARSLAASIPNPAEAPSPGQGSALDAYGDSSAYAQAPASTSPYFRSPADQSAGETGDGYHPGGITDEEAAAQGMDDIQMSIMALKDSIGQGRELKEREKERQELAEALEADHVELADRENILANYGQLVAEQDAIIADRTQKRDAAKNELSQLTIDLEQTQAQLDAMRQQHAEQLQPLEGNLGRARAAADQAKNDERSRKSELSAAESELRKASETDANTMAVARHQQVQASYDEARVRSEQAKEQLAEAQRAYDDAKQRSEQAQGPLERNIADMNARMESLKGRINSLGEELSAARNRRQYCDNVYQYPNETALMRSEVEQAEALARQMDAKNDELREQLAISKQKALKAKIAIAAVAVIIIVIIIAFIVVGGR